ncbi:hypothetical protein QQS21_000970 [Conoideocrella luteorostrata]|uniref:Protein kinase domain-containing protein n=1 Tax=Conoideocrella luteorostrata TaxID=1105319 RepID=A0AAJ0CXZ8_9HYPO|nr:hypothetical protein QQS21_000970 [Conoideocrella luteorostrata]
MFEISDESVLGSFEQGQLRNPWPRKELDGRVIYIAKELEIPKRMGTPVLCEFGSAAMGGAEHLEYAQPNTYGAPEVILEVPWTYSVDIWNVGGMIRDVSEGRSLFTGQDLEFQTYLS